MDVFIDYKREERQHAEKLARALESLGYSVWFDAALIAGAEFRSQIKNSLGQAKCVICLWSKLAVESKWIRTEAIWALEQDKLLSAVIEPVRLPPPFNAYEYVDLSSWNADLSDQRFQSLVHAVERLVGKKARVDHPDAASWAVAQAAGVPSAFEHFIKIFPNSPFSQEARRRLELIKTNAPRQGKVFLSYRQDDSQAVARLIFERLGKKIGRENIFFDVDAIPFGVDFRDHIFGQLVQCQTMLAIIGRDWTGQTLGGPSRIQDEADFVRLEVELGIKQKLRLIPVLAGAAPMPKVTELPESLKSLPYIQGTKLDLGKDYEAHIVRLIAAVTGDTSELLPGDKRQ